jgi:hypothetical protein
MKPWNTLENIITIGIDPGLTGTGLAIFRRKILVRVGTVTVSSSKQPNWQDRAMTIAMTVRTICMPYTDGNGCADAMHAFIEYPAFHQSAGGQMVARRGDLLKLTYLTGLIAGHLSPINFTLVPVIQWKGTLPKEVTQERIRRELLPRQLNLIKSHHSYDAVGIALYGLKNRRALS